MTWRRALRRALIGATVTGTAWVAATTAWATDASRHIEGLRSQPDLPIPSLARVLIAAAVTIGLAIGVLLLVQRFLPKFAARSERRSNAAIRVLARTNLTRTLHVHLLEVEGNHVLIVEGRGKADLAVLPRRDDGAPREGST